MNKIENDYQKSQQKDKKRAKTPENSLTLMLSIWHQCAHVVISDTI